MTDHSPPHHDIGSLSGLTEREAHEFNRFFLLSFVLFTLVAIVAHFLVWQWRPWLQQPIEPVVVSQVLAAPLDPIV